MPWTGTLEREIHYTYAAAASLMKMVDEDELDWKPEVPAGAESTGWMTVGQLLHHMAQSCGLLCNAFEKNDWSWMKHGGAEGPLPAAASVAEALGALEADRAVALAAVHAAGDERLESEKATAPWGLEGSLGQQMLDCVKHLGQHKGQLFYYLKLLGRPVHTGHLWGLD